VLIGLKGEVRFVDIGGIVDRHRIKFYNLITKWFFSVLLFILTFLCRRNMQNLIMFKLSPTVAFNDISLLFILPFCTYDMMRKVLY
jgi:hypothetical protein